MTLPRLYTELADWWPLLSDPADYAEEAAIYRAALAEAGGADLRTILELGSGGGSNASHLKAHHSLTLVDLSPGMLEVSRALNPECEHLPGDMRTVRVGRTFDAVFVHDAVMYLTTESDLLAAMRTAYVHCRPGGVALFVPDDTKETWRSETKWGGHDGASRGLRYLEWSWDPDPRDTAFDCTFVLLLREGRGRPRVETDHHRMGLFPRAGWERLLTQAGFEARSLPYEHSSFAPGAGRRMFLGLRP